MGGIVLSLLALIVVVAAAALVITWALGMWGRRASQEGRFEPDGDRARPVSREVTSPTIEHTRSPGD